ncbi:sporulation lipoprotein, YhcN/YlaJ family [Thermoanaerobacter thermohydrosulfuricus]|uniref:Sporulation lipoprotein, YhcN/YlaJ family n=3 Tax=Thermoanaerobacter TaxID=1754 RepID=G2MTK5_9THEO|nr:MULTISPECIES: YhcN/YlaJ family sporulation lipoprotein [Thermoanaerobacter]MBE3592838.1 YhcN/YlaJ family sporulation lipoprotein [Thermoanaerobacter sp.]AEM79019.1 sporulation lipoprotein, YhcN/YlaJ family [Thermoanaerobacter wiegelii Rt8.B1]EMT38356.1 sporulation lipoprotein, YhcN/YlaJ family [Thermoanaerobacter thermohydrosulfuricus WC1]SDF96947.1 sporulation lipoprotein, YhcN/YlaJ family [Thermoanaerobacter thermohydrosulfuricus]SFE20830.1 sporulation lipoprotein, YhcN/YlaJ family [Therm
MKKIKSIITIMLIGIMIMVSMAGCKTATKKPTPARYTPAPTRTTPAPSKTAPGYTTPAPTTPTPAPTAVRKPTPESVRASKIASNVAKIPEVNKATVVISGTNAIVGVDMKARVQGAHETDVKKKIEKTVKDTDKSIKRVYITADPDLYKRIDNIAKGISEGRPVSEFAKQISEIIKRITPGM